jgi:hypothetical protein
MGWIGWIVWATGVWLLLSVSLALVMGRAMARMNPAKAVARRQRSGTHGQRVHGRRIDV